MKSIFKGLIARMYYLLGKFMFASGIAGRNSKLHQFCMRQLQRSADFGYLPALILFGQLLSYRGATALNKQAGVNYLAKASKQLDATAMFTLAEQLDKNPDVLLPSHEIADLYQKSAKAGHIMAALRLSQGYKVGKWGLSVDLKQAEYWSQQFHQHANQE